LPNGKGKMNVLLNWLRKPTAFQILVSGYALITIIGAVLLSLPISSTTGKHQPFLDALFVAASGISTTGLSVVDIGSFYNIFGQIVLLCIFQIGGIGYMTFIISLAYLVQMELPIIAKAVARESLSGPDYRMLGRFFMSVLAFTFLFELAGAVVLTLFWSKEFPLGRAVYLGIFHSVSAFCTAGFGIFSDNLMRYRTSSIVNITIIVVSIAGGIGFIVLYDLCIYFLKILRKQYPRRLSAHSKLVILVSLAVMSLGSAIIFFAESWPQSANPGQKLMVSAFQAVSASTTDGFNTLDIGVMTPTSLTFIMFLMFVGASPGSTGGGIKTSTLGLLFVFLWSHLKTTRTDINIFERRILPDLIYRAFSVFTWFILIIIVDMVILSATEKASYLQILFETVSALGNTGLSMGITSSLSSIGKMVLIVTMFVGRIGPLAAGLFFIGKQKPVLYEYPTETIFIG
jgi:trk system potassium uptake protein TrkH